jgi:hypothetical protein
MADPVSAILYTVAAGGIAAFSYEKTRMEEQAQKNQAKVAEANARLQQQQMEYNQRMAEREAKVLEAEGIENARRIRAAAELERSQRIAMLGKSGAAMSSGSPLAVLGAAASAEELSIADSRYGNSRQVSQLMTKASDYAFGAKVQANNVSLARASKPSKTAFGLNLVSNTLDTTSKALSLASAIGGGGA